MKLQNRFRLSELNIIIACFALIKLGIHIYADFVSGYHWDELLHIECGNHLAWGYADFPPMIGLVAWFQNLLNSEAIFINRFFIHLAGIATFVVSALLVIKLGGGRKAVMITLLCLLCSPLVWASHTLFLPVGFNQFFQLLAIYFLVCYFNDLQDKNLFFLAIAVALGFMTKYLIGYLIIAMVISVLLFNRPLLTKKVFWKALALFLLIITPNIIWQTINDFPVLKHISALIDTDLNNSSLIDELIAFMRFFNPFILIIGFIGLFSYVFRKEHKTYRLVGFTLLSMFFLILFTNGKFYYTAPAIIPAIALGAVTLEKWIQNRILGLYLIAFLILVSGIVLVPSGMPLFKPEKYVELYKIETTADGRTPIYFQHFYSKNLYNDVLLEFEKISDSLPEDERKNLVIWGKHYAYSGIVDLYREEYGFPMAINHMGVYHDWIPELDKEATYITTGERNLTKDFWLQFFNSVEEVSMIPVKYSWDFENSAIRFYICRELKYNKDELKQLIDKFYGV